MTTGKRGGIERWVLLRLIPHIFMIFLLLMAGAYVVSYQILPRFFPDEARPVALLIGMSAGLLFAAVPALVGIGLRVITEIAVKGESSRTSLFDLLAFTQYLTIALVLLAIHYWA